MSPEEILRHLTPEQRREFEELLSDPTKAAGLLDLETENQSCWWIKKSEELEEDPTRAISKPKPLPLTKLLKPSATAAALQYNLLAILWVLLRAYPCKPANQPY